MKRILVFTFLLPYFFAFAQEDERQQYEKTVDYVTCFCIKNTKTGANKKNCEVGEYYQKSDFAGEVMTVRLYEDFQKLKSKNVPNDIVSFLSEDVFTSEEYPEIKKFAENRKHRISGIKSEIREHLLSIYHNAPSEVLEKEASSSDTQRAVYLDTSSSISKENEMQGTSFFAINLWNFWTIILLLILLGLIISVFRLSDKISSTLRGIHREIERFKQQLLTPSSLVPQNTHHQRKIEEKLERLKEKIDKLESFNNFKKESTTNESNEVILNVSKSKEPEITSFYMATPDKSGFFNLSSQHNSFKQGATYYKFYIDKSNNSKGKAEFEFFSDDYGIKASANYPQTYIEPACDPQNAQNPNAKSIVTIAKGKAEEQGDKWIVTQKAKIKYE